jgi:hypothetical protein
MDKNDSLLDPRSASDYTRLSVPALAQLRYLGRGPKYLNPTPRKNLYRRSDLDTWLNSSERLSTAGE